MKSTLVCFLLLGATTAAARHSYAMFDGRKTATVSGTVAKLEWRNPHVFLWLYVPKPGGGHGLYAFENGSTGVLLRLGWTAQSLVPGEKVTVEYWPLKDGRPGGHFYKATRASGEVLEGAGGPNIRLRPPAPLPAAAPAAGSAP